MMSLEIGILILITDEDLLVKIMSDDLRIVVNMRIKTLDTIRDASQIKFVRLRKKWYESWFKFYIHVMNDHLFDLLICIWSKIFWLLKNRILEYVFDLKSRIS